MGEGTYFNFDGVTVLDTTVANQGDVSFSPPTTQCSSDAQASVRIELESEETFDHDLPKLSVRTMRQPVKSLAKPRHLRPTQLSDVRAPHVRVEEFVSVVHGVTPSTDAATRIPLDELRKLAMHRVALVHESDDAVSWAATPTACGADHEVPPSSVKRIREPPDAASRIAHVIAA